MLSTIHSAKGQEWRSVFVLNVVDGCIPSDSGPPAHGGDRGRAAAAVCGHDRARDHLHLVLPQRFFTHQQARRGDRHVYAARTRSSPSRSCRTSTFVPGRSCLLTPPPHPQHRFSTSISAPGCERCGVERGRSLGEKLKQYVWTRELAREKSTSPRLALASTLLGACRPGEMIYGRTKLPASRSAEGERSHAGLSAGTERNSSFGS